MRLTGLLQVRWLSSTTALWGLQGQNHVCVCLPLQFVPGDLCFSAA